MKAFALALLLAAAPAPKSLSDADAQRLLAAPVRVDAKAGAVLRKSAQKYAALKSLLTISTTDGITTTSRMKRPRLLHSLQQKPSGELIRLTISDGKDYYDYLEASRKYVVRSGPQMLNFPLPFNVRPFWVDASRGNVMKSIKGEAAVREFAFAYAREEKVGGKPADRIRVSTLVRGPSGWQTFDSIRSYDRASGLLVQVASGPRRTLIKNQPNVSLPTEGFVWKPIPDATRSFE
jgi:hypothetical protein